MSNEEDIVRVRDGTKNMDENKLSSIHIYVKYRQQINLYTNLLKN